MPETPTIHSESAIFTQSQYVNALNKSFRHHDCVLKWCCTTGQLHTAARVTTNLMISNDSTVWLYPFHCKLSIDGLQAYLLPQKQIHDQTLALGL